MRALFFGTLAVSLLAFTLAGCGQKGPLYFPEDEDDEQAKIEQNLTVYRLADRGPVTRESVRRL